MKKVCTNKKRFPVFGFTLVEVAFSLALVAFCLAGLFVLFSQGMQQARTLQWMDRATLIASSLFAQLQIIDAESDCAWIQTKSGALKIPFDFNHRREIVYGDDFLPLGDVEFFDSVPQGYFVELHTILGFPHSEVATCMVAIRRSRWSPESCIFSSIISRESL